jgi:protein-L-isoaspartate(D-aspartate) O-methyltransferase
MAGIALEEMVDRQIRARGVRDARVLDAMLKVDRALFVPWEEQSSAYEDHPLPIGQGQTISQPYIVAFMTELLRPRPADRLLEIGTGSGYQTAILAEVVAEVHSVEIVASLGRRASERLAGMGYRNVHVHLGDGTLGWPSAAPYDGIIVTAAPATVPVALTEQLRAGGRLVIPVGASYDQMLRVIEKKADGTLHEHDEFAVRFVPMTGGAGGGEGR